MNLHSLKQVKGSLLTLMLSAALVACSASQGAKTFSVNTEGIIEAQVSDMNKDAVRLKGEILSKGTRVRDRWQYRFKVSEIVKYGATFATVQPKEGEEVLLITPSEVKFNKNSQIVLDALTPTNRSEGVLTINMITE